MHNEHVTKTIELVQGQIHDLENELAQKKRTVNDLCALIGQPPVYADATPGPSGMIKVRSDEFYGKRLATVVRSILERRASANLGAASLDDIFDTMQRGGFAFASSSDANSKRALAISLVKNTVTFIRLPNGDFGLVEWYPDVPKPRAANGGDKDTDKPDDKPAAQTAKEDREEFLNNFDSKPDEKPTEVTAKKK
jgi:hypothetical protein